MFKKTDDLRITQVRPLIPPAILLEELPVSEEASNVVASAREAIAAVVERRDPRLVVIVGPCSIHDPRAALDYAERLVPLQQRYANQLIVVMRTYFEKPRTSVGWKGLINDPDLDGSFHINKGLRLARRLLLDVNNLGIPTASEFLDTQIPQHIADLTSWVAIGARTTESQVHRELASGLSMPVGFKNGTDGGTQTAVDAVLSARSPHLFPSVTKQGVSAIFETTGNATCHVILRGGSRTGPNYEAEQGRRSLHATGGSGTARVRDDRLLARQQPEGLPAAGDRGAVHCRASRLRLLADPRRHAREPSARGPAGLRPGPSRRVRAEHHRRVHLVAADRTDPRGAGRGAANARRRPGLIAAP